MKNSFAAIALGCCVAFQVWGEETRTNLVDKGQSAGAKPQVPPGVALVTLVNAGDRALQVTIGKNPVVLECRLAPNSTTNVFLRSGASYYLYARDIFAGNGSSLTTGYQQVNLSEQWVFSLKEQSFGAMGSGQKAWAVEQVSQATAEEIAAVRKTAAEKAQKKKSEADERLLKFHQEKASKGDAYGQYRMGQRYLTGDGVEKDLAKAREMFTKSAAQGNEDAAKALAALPPP